MEDADTSLGAGPPLGDAGAMVRLVRQPDGAPGGEDAVARRRRLLVRFLRLWGEQVSGRGDAGPAAPAPPPATAPAPDPAIGLPPRVRQTLARLLAGDAEKQIAARLGLSRHTVHVYVKSLYRHFDVSSRGELLSRFVRASALAMPMADDAARARPGPHGSVPPFARRR